MATHNMEEADSLCQRVAIVDHGKIIALGTPEELKRSIPGGYLVRLQVSSKPAGLVDAVRRLQGVSEVRESGEGQLDVYADHGGSLVPDVVAAAAASGAAIHDLHISEPSLENLFLHHTGRSLRE